jgi:Holin of 3TMs, for gene-transfer release
MSTEVKSESAKKNEDWMNSKWRPAMGWMYMLVCTADFVFFPILWSLVQVLGDGKVETQWSPITLQGAGLFHMAMGAILGIAAYGRTQEKLGDKAGATLQTPSTPAPSFGSPSPTPAPSFGSPSPTPSFGSSGSFGTTASGKKIVPQDDQPML